MRIRAGVIARSARNYPEKVERASRPVQLSQGECGSTRSRVTFARSAKVTPEARMAHSEQTHEKNVYVLVTGENVLGLEEIWPSTALILRKTRVSSPGLSRPLHADFAKIIFCANGLGLDDLRYLI